MPACAPAVVHFDGLVLQHAVHVPGHRSGALVDHQRAGLSVLLMLLVLLNQNTEVIRAIALENSPYLRRGL